MWAATLAAGLWKYAPAEKKSSATKMNSSVFIP